MLKTPENLQERFNIPASAGAGRAIPRALFAYAGPLKKQFLTTMISMIVGEVLPEYGQNRKYYKPVSQRTLAEMCGLRRRETFTRYVTRFTPSGTAWPDEDRDEWSRKKRSEAIARGRAERNGPRRSIVSQAPLLTKKRRFAETNLYGMNMPDTPKPDDPAGYYPPGLKDLLEDDRTSRFFSETARGFRSFEGFKNVPRWLWDPRLKNSHGASLSVNARLVMTYYFLLGLGSKHRDSGQLVGEVHPNQGTVAAACGISKSSVYRANKELVGLSLIRVAHDKPTIGADGQYRRGPAKILYLPVRTFTKEEADNERERLAAALFAKARHESDARVSLIQNLHRELLDAWTGSERTLGVFWRDFRRRLKDNGIQSELIRDLVPKPPE